MANTPPDDYRDPHVSTPEQKTGMAKWLIPALAILLGLLLLAWLLGLFADDDDMAIVPADATNETVVVPEEPSEEPVVVEPVEPAEQPAAVTPAEPAEEPTVDTPPAEPAEEPATDAPAEPAEEPAAPAN